MKCLPSLFELYIQVHLLISNNMSLLTHWGRDKMATISQTTLSNEILIKISLKFVPKVPINNIPSLVQIMAWRRPGDKPLSEPMMVSLLMHSASMS